MATLLCGLMAHAHDFEVDGIYYDITSSANLTVSVTYEGNSYSSAMYSGSIVIPETIEYDDCVYSVTNIGVKAFYKCSNLTNINIPNSVTSIGNEAFSNCSNLESVVMANSVTSIGDEVFYCCSNLNRVALSNSMENIGAHAFYGCKSLTDLTIPNSVRVIGTQAFDECAAIQIEKNVKYVDKWAVGVTDNSLTNYTLKDNTVGLLNTFFQCYNLTSITIPNSVKSFCSDTFNNCTSLSYITLPSDLEYIGIGAFAACRKLTSVYIPIGVKVISDMAFNGCNGLVSVSIPEGVTDIGMASFSGCYSLTSVTLPSTLESMDEMAFSGCTSLATVTCLALVVPYSDDNLFPYASKAILFYPAGSDYSAWTRYFPVKTPIVEEMGVCISADNKWSTCVIPFSSELPEGVRAFVSTELDGNSVLLEEVSSLNSYTPYILYAKDGYTGTLTGYMDKDNFQKTVTDGVLSGAIVEQSISEGYILQNQGSGMKFYNVNGQTFTIPAGKCWLSAFDASGASVTMRFTGGVTGIEGVCLDSPTGIEADETMYDLEGRRVENPLPGRVYIKGGKKVMLKN